MMGQRVRNSLVGATAAMLALGACSGGMGGGSASPAGGGGTSGTGPGVGAAGSGAGAAGSGAAGAGSGAAGAAAGTAGGGGTGTTAPEDLLPPQVHAAKVKNLLLGLPLTDSEFRTLKADPAALKGMIPGWIEQPEWRGRMMTFFKQAFQQTQTDINDYDEQLGRTTNPWNGIDKIKFVRSAEESFARTVLALIDEGAPFTEVLTTGRFMLNPPLMSSYAYMDTVPLTDDAPPKPIAAANWLLQKYPTITFTRTTNPDPATNAPRPIPFEDSINPASPNFMVWYEPKPYAGTNSTCKEPDVATKNQALRYAADWMYGGRPGCGSSNSQFSDADWAAWRMVTVRKPKNAAEERTIFWNLPAMRQPQANELIVNTPRVGFMTTPAFFANWPTNVSNAYRVTTNQSLIVGLGRSFDDRGTTVQLSESSVDNMHIQPNTPCYGCHLTLDPMRDFFRQSYSLSYFQQLDKVMPPPAVATFTVDGSAPVMGNGIAALASAMAKHPRFAEAWTQKLCQFANSSSCSDDDPVFKAVAGRFVTGKFNFKALIADLFSSPLVTFASATKTSNDNGVVISIARREGLCAAIENRFKLVDPCNLRGENTAKVGVRTTATNLAGAVPGGGYTRGDESPLFPHSPNMFFHGATENLCTLLAGQLVNAGTTSRYTSAKKDEAVADFVSTVMGLPASDSRAPIMAGILNDHYNAAAAKPGVLAADALKSTFILACASPLGISLGL